MAKKPQTAAELKAHADELAAAAKAARKEAAAAARREKREAEKRAAEKLARDEIAAFQYSKNMTVKGAEGEPKSVYDWVMESYRQSPEYDG